MRLCFGCFEEYDEEFDVCPHCGAIFEEEPVEAVHLRPGTVLNGRYVLGRAVGAGGFGIVYKSYDKQLKRIVAVKEFFVSRLVTRAAGLNDIIIYQKHATEFEYRKERFLAEARTMAKFGDHRSIPNVKEYFEANNTAYIVMELLSGVTLSDYLREKGGKMDVNAAIRIANEIGNALKAMHKEGIIHKDVAPDNIFICSKDGKEEIDINDSSAKIKLMDLGAAKLADSVDKVIDVILKPGYSPTEQYDPKGKIGPYTDIYALGATMYILLTGVKPDESTNRKQQDTVVPPIELNQLVSQNLSNAIMKAMALETNMRFRSVNEFLEAINGERKVETLEVERKRKKRRQNVGIILACAAMLAGVAVGIGIYGNMKASQSLKPADISVWFSVADGSTEEDAMNSVKADFEKTFPGVNLELKAIPEKDYEKEIVAAAKEGKLPTLFESSGVEASILDKAKDLDNVIKSDQFKDISFLSMYNDFYSNKKQMPLAMEVPVAYVITNGATSVKYDNKFFENLKDFGSNVNISYDSEYKELLASNFDVKNLSDKKEFMDNSKNTSPVMLSSTMALNEVRNTITNYEKAYVYPNLEKINCRFIYEWSIGDGESNEIRAAERLLSWMLGNVYQSALMVSKCNDGQIPLNTTCFESKIEMKNLKPIADIYTKFTFNK